MVAVVSGSGLGLFASSTSALGPQGAVGPADLGQAKEKIYVNAATGNLVIQHLDDSLAATGLDIGAVRTYNSQGKLDDDNADNWKIGLYRRVYGLTGTVNTAGSTVIKVFGDGAEVVYSYDTALAKYVATGGDGAHDTLTWNAATSQWTWTDGSARNTETYDATGRLLNAKDADGNTVTYTYTGALLTQVADASGQTTFLDYTGNNLTAIRVVSSGVTQTLTRYAYDASNRLITVTVDLSPGDNAIADGNTYVTSYTYDGTSKRIASITQKDGSSIAFTYQSLDGAYRVKTFVVTNAGGNRTTTLTYSSYNTAGAVYLQTDVLDPLGLTTTYTQDSAGRLTKVLSPTVDGARLETRYAYDAGGNLTSVTEDPTGLNRVSTLAYDTRGNVLSVRDSLGNTVTRTYSANNQLLTEVRYLVRDPDGAGAGQPSVPLTTRFVYDAEEHLRFSISADGRVTEHRYNAVGQRILTLQYVGGLYTAAPFAESDLTTWAAAQNLTLLQRADYAYDFRGSLTTHTQYVSTNSSGGGTGTPSITRYVYDQRGTLLQTIEARGEATTTDANDYKTTYTYDGLGRLLTTARWISGSATSTTVNAYDDVNRRITTTLANGLITTSTYNQAGELISVAQGVSGSLGTTTYTYDANGRLRYVTDPTGVRQFHLYDEAGRLAGQVDGDGTVTRFVYNRANQVIKAVQYSVLISNATLTALAQTPTTVTLSALQTEAGSNASQDRVTRRVYDNGGLLVYAIDEIGAVTQYLYDGANRLTDEIRYATPVSIARATNEVLPGSLTITPAATDRRTRHFYDNDGNLIASLDSEGYLSEYQYDPAGFLVKQIGYATRTLAAYWAAGTLAQLRPSADNETAVTPEQDLVSYSFYDGQGRQIGALDGEGYLTETIYDVAGNVSQSVRYNRVLTYVAGTSTFQTLKTAATGAATQAASYQYDGAGRVTQETNHEGTVTTYTYDSVGNLLSMTRASGADPRTTEARYDFLGRVTQELTAEGRALIAGGMTQTQIDDIWSRYGVVYAYDLGGRKISATRRPNDTQTNVTRYYYDNDNRLRFEVNALGERKEYRYNALGQLTNELRYTNRISTTGLTGGLLTATLITQLTASTSSTDASIAYTYSLTGQVASTVRSVSAATTDTVSASYTYNSFGEATVGIEQIDASRSLRHDYSYDNRGLLTLTRWDSAGLNTTEARQYDAFGRLAQVTDARGNTNRIEYDRLGRSIATVDELGGRRLTTYDAFSRALTIRDALNNTTTYTYNDSTRTTTLSTPEGVLVNTVRNRHGQTLSVSAGGNVTTYAYDLNGQLTGASDSLGSLESRTYDRAGRQLTAVDARGVTTTFAYDAADRVLTRTVDSGSGGLALVTTYTYDGQGRITRVQEPTGRITDTAYDRDGRVTQIAVDPSGLNLRTTYAYDRQGQVVTVTEGAGSSNPRTTQYTYDNLGRRTQEVVDPGTGKLNLTTQYKYDANGNLTRKIDARNYSTWYVYDAANRLTHSVDALGGVTETAYDAENRVTSTRRYATAISAAQLTALAGIDSPTTSNLTLTTAATDRLEQTIYDRDGRERYSINALGGVTERTFDANGNVTRTRVYVNAVAAGTYATPAMVATALTNAGNNISTLSANDRVQWTAYDLRNRAAFSIDGLGGVTQYQYDGNGNLTQSTAFATLRATSLATDLASLQSWATANAGNAQNRTTRYWYDTTDRLRFSLDAEGYLSEQRYNDAGRVDTTVAYAAKPTVAAGATLANVVTAAAAIANAGNDQNTASLYDAAGRLSRVTDTYTNYEEYTYDAVGNKLTYRNQKGSVWTYVYDANGRLLDERSPQVAITTVSDSGATLTSDGAGVTASIVTRMTYDAVGNVLTRTEGITRLASGAENTAGSRVTSYIYDALGRQTRTTYPAVGVYNAAGDNVNLSGTAVVRNETSPPLYSEVAYDTLGNAFRNRDVAGNYSFKVYDSLGRVQYEVDAENYATRYTYDVFGNQLTLTRYANRLSSALSTTNNAVVATDITSRLTASAAADRTMTTTYDRLNRVTQVAQTAVFNFETNVGSAGGTTFTAGATTVSEYNAFGQVVRSRRLVNPTTSQYADTYFYYDRRGLKTAEVDPLKYLSLFEYDETGDLKRQLDYARPVTGTVSIASYGTVVVTTPASSPNNAAGYDRETLFAYDRLNRKLSETKVNVEYTTVSGTATTAATGTQVTSFGYDAVGNLVSTTANGATTYTYYDVLGRAIAIAEPTRDRGDGTNITPLTLLRRDAYGNLVEQIQYANGAASVSASSFTAGATSTNDRTTRVLVDKHGHAIRTEDGNAADRFASYNARGEIAKEWQIVVNPGANAATTDDTTDALVTIYQYDKLGRQTALVEPQRVTGTPLIVTTQTEYNAFGEVTRKGVVDGGVDSGRQEYFDYDQMGRVWRTNGGDGVDKVYAYNLAGNATAEIKSKTLDLATAVTSASAALASSQTLRMETAYDVLGRVLAQREAQFSVASPMEAINATFQFGSLPTPTPPNAVYQLVASAYFGSYVVNPVPWEQGGGYYQVSPPSEANPLGVYARVAQASYQLTQKAHIYWTAPIEPGLTKVFEYRPAGGGGWSTLSVNQVTASQLGVDVSGVTSGSYEYRVSYIRAGDTDAYAQATGTFNVTQSTITTLSVSTAPAVSGVSLMSAIASAATTSVLWLAPDPTVSAQLEVRLSGSSTWSTYAATYTPAVQGFTPAFFSASLPTVGGVHEYRITHTRNGAIVAMGSGSLTITASNTTTSGSNTPDAAWASIGTLAASTTSVTGNPTVNFSWAYSAGATTNIFNYRPVGGAWVNLTPTVSGSTVSVNLGALPPGNYEFSATQGIFTGYTFSGTSSTGTFVVTGTSATVTSQVATAPYGNMPTMTATAVVPPPVVTTTIRWPIPSGIPGAPLFSYRLVGSSTWVAGTITQSGGNNVVSMTGLSGTYEYSLSYIDMYSVYATAAGQFSVSGTTATVLSQANWTLNGGTASYLAGVTVSGSQLNWSAAPQPGASITVTYTNTSNGATGSLSAQTSNGTQYSANFYGLASGTYRYQISYTNGGNEYLRGSGSLTVTTNTTPASAGAGTPTAPGQITGFADFGSSTGYLVWSTPAEAGAAIVFRYKPSGATAWAGTLSVFNWNGGYAVNTAPLSGAIDYEVTYTRAGQYTPYMIGGGSTTIIRTPTTGGSTSQPNPLTPTLMVPLLLQSVDRWGNVLSLTDALNKTINYRYNQDGQLSETLLPTTTVVSTLGGTVTTTTTRSSTRNYYDLFGRLIATRDGNGNLNRVTYNTADEVIVETHADGGVKRYVNDAFHQRVQITDELGFRTRNVYDKVGNLITVAQELTAGAFTNSSPFDLAGAAANLNTHAYKYDEAGRRISETTGDLMASGTPETNRYWYDLQGNIVQRMTPRGRLTTYEYDVEGHKTKETDAINGVSTWATNYFGRLSGHVNLGGASYSYGYNELGLLASQTNSLGQNITYQYDEVGHLTLITENSVATGGSGLANVNRVTEYSYDIVGRHIRERTVVDGLVHQDTHIAYDELGRISELSDLRYRDNYSYDAAGNRTNIHATYFDHAGTLKSDDLWYTYDAMNRVDISQGVNSSNTVSLTTTQGVDLAYDAKGQRISARTYSKRLEITVQQTNTGYGIFPVTTYAEVTDYATEIYGYDGAGRLISTDREARTTNKDLGGTITSTNNNPFRISTRVYDGASRELSDNYVTFEPSGSNVTPTNRARNSSYDDDGRVATQTTLKNSVKESFIIYGDSTYTPAGPYTFINPFTGTPITITMPESYTPGYDAAGNLRGYVVQVYNTNTTDPEDVAYTSTYRTNYRLGEAYQESGQTVSSSSGGPTSGSTSRTYNVNGELVQFTDSRDQAKNRYFANAAQGQALTVVQGQYDGQSGRATAIQAFTLALGNPGPYNTTKAQHFFFANGQQVGSFGQLTENGQFVANFDVNFTPVSSNYPGAVPGEVVVQKGDTLRGVAARVYGDANLWYLIAEENGLALGPNTELEAGSVLRIPNEVVSLSNNATSFKPFNVQDAIGDTTPTQPLPPPPKAKKGCGLLGQIIVIVVAIIVTVYTAGAAAGGSSALLGSTGAAAGSTWAAGTAALSGGLAAGAGASIGAAAIGGAIGSIVSQGVGIALGVQDGFDWKGVALGAIGAGVGAGLGAAANGISAISTFAQKSPYLFAAANGVAANALTQGIAVATGLQKSFSWRDVAISAVAAPIAKAAGGLVAGAISNPSVSNFAGQFAGGLAGSLVRGAFHGKIDMTTVLADAFGNAVGNSVVESMIYRHEQWDLFRAQQALVRRAAETNGQSYVDDLVRSGMSQTRALGFLESNAGQEHVSLLETIAAADEPFSLMSRREQADTLESFQMTDRLEQRVVLPVSGVSAGNVGEVTIDEIIVTADRKERSVEARYIDGAAGVIDISARGVNTLVDWVGGPENAERVITGGSILLAGPARTLGGMLVDRITSAPLSAAESWLSDKLQTHVFGGRGAADQSVVAVSDAASAAGVGLAANVILGVGAKRVVEGSQSYVRGADNFTEEVRSGFYSGREWRAHFETQHPGAVQSTTVPRRNDPNVRRANASREVYLRDGTRIDIPFDERGFPIFDNVAQFNARLSQSTASIRDRDLHARVATESLRDAIRIGQVSRSQFAPDQLRAIMNGRPTIPRLTWHHHQDYGRMQLIPREVHRQVGHIGGYEMWRGR